MTDTDDTTHTFAPHIRHPSFVDHTGRQYGRLTVLGFAGRHPTAKYPALLWTCRCSCGTIKNISAGCLVNGTRSCGCLQKESVAKLTYKHGMANSPLFMIWSGMHSRCKDMSNKDYGGRGIRICKRWNEFANFLADMGDRPSPKHSIERKDVNGHYCPENCVWATRQEQHNNTRVTKWITLDGITKSLADWARTFNISDKTVRDRLVRGWTEAAAIKTPLLKSNGKPMHPAE